MLTPDRQEIMFAGAGILWGATTFFRGVNLWRTIPGAHDSHTRSAITMSVVGGVVLIIGCSTYLVWSVSNNFH